MKATRPKYLKQIRERILNAEDGAVFVANDFVDITDKKTANVDLSRLENEGTIKRVIRGVYYKPWYSELIGQYVVVSTAKVAEAIARNNGWTIFPYGDAALNMLGLSTQVPAVMRYVSTGPYKEYRVGNKKIAFKRTTNRYISGLSYKSGLIVVSLLAMGRDNIDKKSLAHLHDSLTPTEKNALLTETKRTPYWVYESIKEICQA